MGKLIRLELCNFKSYKGHHVLLFGDSYFTSIIGPNGSGKSNSMDAISFVLGIKSSYLRSTHLRDLVYRGRVLKTSKIDVNGDAIEQANGVNGDANGHVSDDEATQQRDDPTSAWVMAVYEDDAGEEQKWKRTVTSAGTSEYKINNKSVGAKQYNEALEAENILIKARNFLVFQGDVESIANQTPKDLARLVEQISGSLEYKSEFEKLEEEANKASEDHIEKANHRKTINTEVKRYTEDKRTLDDYNRKQDERDDAIVNHVLWKLYHLQQVIEDSSAEIGRFQDEVKEHKRGVETYEKNLEDAKKEQSKAGRDVANQERSIKRASKSAEEKRDQLDPIEEKLKLSQKNQDKFKKRISEISKERDNQSKTVDKYTKDLSTVQKAQTQWEQEWQQRAKNDGRQLKEADLQEYNRLRTDVNKRTANVQIKLDNLTRQKKTDEETVVSFKAKTEESEKKLARLQDELKDLKERKSDNKSTADQTTKEVDAKKKDLNRLTSDRLKTSQRHTELDEKLQSVLRKLVEADDGRRESEKEIRMKEIVTKMKRIFPGIQGRVHELCKPKAKKYETAVSTVLGRHFDSVVVDTEKSARDCMAYLKEQEIGQVTFLPLDTIQVTSIHSNLKGMDKNMKLAIDVIDYDNGVERAMASACGNSMVCEDLNTAKHLVYEKRVDARAVTLEGTVIHKGGLMTGGRGPNDNKRQKVWDDTQLDQWRKMKDKLLGDIAALPKAQDAVVQEETLQSELSALQQRVAFAQDEIKALDKNIESKQKETQHVQKQLQEVAPKYQEHSASFEQLQERLAASQSEVGEVEDEVFKAFCKRLKYDDIRAYEAQQGTSQQENAQKKLEFTMQRSKLEAQLNFEKQRLQTTQDRIKNIQEASERDQHTVTDLESQRDDLQTELEQSQQEIESLEEQLTAVKKTQDEKAGLVAEARRELQKRNKEIDAAMKEVTGLEAEVQRNSSSRYALLRKCKIDGVDLPLTEDSEPLDALPVEEATQPGSDPDAMDVDEEDTSRIETAPVHDYGITIDFDKLDDDLKDDNTPTAETNLTDTITALTTTLHTLQPNTRALDRLSTARQKLQALDSPLQDARRLARDTSASFETVRAKRADLFSKAFTHIRAEIKPIYKKLTQSADIPNGGHAYLNLLSADDARPWEGGIKYAATPPTKRFRDIDALSGGEKTIAALALLFAVHSFAPSPFFVLDEVDAALDNANVAKVARYIREHRGVGMQFVVISLKTGLFQESDTLVGVLRDQGGNSSRAVTLDLRKYQPS